MDNTDRPEIQFDNGKKCFCHAIESGILSSDQNRDNYAGWYMYMYSDLSDPDTAVDFFKHTDTREYVQVKRDRKPLQITRG